MATNYIIITGASKGLGEGIAKALLSTGNHLICISRTESEYLKTESAKKNIKCDQILFDLSYTMDIDALMTKVFELMPVDTARSITLVNNAGVIKPIGPLEDCDSDEIETHMKINFIAPMLLCKEFINNSKAYKCEKRIINISSGAAKNPYFGWSSYCSAKAGIDMLTKVIGTEQESSEYPVKIMSIAPGIIETDMQTIIRSTSEEQFPLRQKFIELKESGKLVKPIDAGQKIATIILSNNFENGNIIDIR